MSLSKLIVCLCIIVISIAGSSALYANSPSNELLSNSNTNFKYAQNQIYNINSEISHLQYKIKLTMEEKNRNNSEIYSLKNNFKQKNHLNLITKNNNKYQLHQLKSQNAFLTKKVKEYQHKISKLKQQLTYWKNKIA